MKHLAALLFLAAAGCSEPPAERPETLRDEFDDAEMTAAIDKARSTVDEFIAVLDSGEADAFSVKAPITDKGGTEHFWIVDVSHKDGTFSGTIGNDPGMVENVEYGDPWSVGRDEISDWMYVRGEMIHGGFTIDPLLHTYPEAEAEAMRAKLVR